MSDIEIKLERQYSYLPYTPARLKRICMSLGWHLENIHAGYKGNRYPGYRERYQVIDTATRKVLNPKIDLEGLRYFFAPLGYPEFDEKSTTKGGE